MTYLCQYNACNVGTCAECVRDSDRAYYDDTWECECCCYSELEHERSLKNPPKKESKKMTTTKRHRTSYIIGDYHVYMRFDVGLSGGPQEWLVQGLRGGLFVMNGRGPGRHIQLCDGLDFMGPTLMCPKYATGEQIASILRREMAVVRREERREMRREMLR